jgi:Transcriptional regulator/sugar kinase
VTIVGVDVGKTRITLIARGSGTKREERPTPRNMSGTEFRRIFNSFMEGVDSPSAVGLSIPGLVDREGLALESAVGIQPMDFSWIEEEYACSVNLANDCDAALLGQKFDLEEYSNAVNVVIGSGIGAGVKFGGDILWSDENGSIEPGFIYVGNSTWHDLCGGHYIGDRFEERTGKTKKPREIFSGSSNEADELLEDLKTENSRAIASIINSFAPQILSFSGSVATNQSEFIQECVSRSKELDVHNEFPEIIISGVKDEPGVEGSLVLADRIL